MQPVAAVRRCADVKPWSESGFVRRSRRTTYENPWLRFEAHDVVHPNGRPGEFGVVITPRSVAVVPLDGDEVVLARQPRYGVDRVVTEIVKGGAAPGEDHRAAAERELREELGLVAARWDALGITYEIPSIVPEPVWLFLARELHAVEPELEEVETIAALRLPFCEAVLSALRGELEDAVSGIALARAAHFLENEL